MFLVDKLFEYYNNITPFQAAFGISLLVLYILHLFLKDYGLPPGPTGLPLIGYWPFLKEDSCHIQLQNLAKKYGDVFSFRVTGTLFIHLASTKIIKEAHLTKSENFGDKMNEYSILKIVFEGGKLH